LHIVIADIHFLVNGRKAPVLLGRPAGSYQPFLVGPSSPRPGLVRIDVDLHLGGFPSFDRPATIFESAETWSMLRTGDGYCWIDVPVSSGRAPTCLAVFRPRPDQVTVYCGEEYIRQMDGGTSIVNPFSYPLDQVLLMYALAEREGMFMHAAAVEMNGKGYLFPGRSGAGKSTISRVFQGRGHALLSDDRVVVRKIGGAWYVFGTPWAGEAGIAENRKLPLGGMLFLRQASQGRIEGLAPAEAAERLMPVSSIPWYDGEAVSSLLAFCEALVTNVPAYDIFFTPDPGVVELCERFLSK
jgi:hypothetical protein